MNRGDPEANKLIHTRYPPFAFVFVSAKDPLNDPSLVGMFVRQLSSVYTVWSWYQDHPMSVQWTTVHSFDGFHASMAFHALRARFDTCASVRGCVDDPARMARPGDGLEESLKMGCGYAKHARLGRFRTWGRTVASGRDGGVGVWGFWAPFQDSKSHPEKMEIRDHPIVVCVCLCESGQVFEHYAWLI